MIASKQSCKVLHQQNPMAKKVKQVKNLFHHLGHHKQHGQDATSKSTCFHSTLSKTFFSCIPQKVNSKRKTHLYNFWGLPTNMNYQSSISKELKFKKSSTAQILRNHRVMTSSLVKFLKNCPSLE
jgi:hypothetical protein